MQQFFDSLRKQGLMVTYDDVRLRTHYSEIEPTDADVRSRLSRNISLNIPIVSSPMDTVTTAPMAIAMAEAGGIGIIHRALSPEEQARHVARTKNRLNGRIDAPIIVGPYMTIGEVLAMRAEKGFSFHTFPVVDEQGLLTGLLRKFDFDRCDSPSTMVKDVMTPKTALLTAAAETDQRKAYDLMREYKRKVLPLVNAKGELDGMYMFSDLHRIFSGEQSIFNLDKHGQLVVGAAVGTGEGAFIRAELLAHKKCDVFHIDTAHGYSRNVVETVRKLKEQYPDIDVIAGNVSSGPGAVRLANAGADGILVGQGSGSICTTRIIAGIGVPQVSAVYECAKALTGWDIPVCADGGIRYSGDIVVALAVGASCVMLGSLLAGTEEAPGETRFIQGMQVKDYRGMGSHGAMRDNASSRERYGQGALTIGKVVPEGVEGIVPYKGHVVSALVQYVGGLKAGMGYHGTKTIRELAEIAEIFRISSAGLNESHPHDITITANAPNYFGR